MSDRRALSAVVAALAFTLVACGTTVKGAGTAGGSSDLSVGGNGAPGGPSAAPGAGAGALGTGGSTGSGAQTTGLGTGGGGAGPLPGGGNVVSTNTAAPLLIGVVNQRNAGAGDAALGADNSDPGSFRADYTAFIKYINAQGGIAGHPLKPVFAEFDATSPQSISTQEQAACDTWTHDNHVFAILVGQSDLLK